MSDVKPELSKQNIYWIEKHRYYELKHFCLQYPDWIFRRKSVDSLSRNPNRLPDKTNKVTSPVEQCIELRDSYTKKINMVEQAAKDTSLALYSYIIVGVTEGVNYDRLKMKYNIPCGRDMYYKMYRKFFWTLSKIRQ